MFELDAASLRRFIFALENQEQHFAVQLSDGELVPMEQLDDTIVAQINAAPLDPRQRYVALPEWTSKHGFAVMEAFAEQQSAAARAALSQALHAGRGAFRAFKDNTKELGLERRFHLFKTRRLRTVLHTWYNELRELAGLDATELGADDELDSLAEEDIQVFAMKRVPSTLIGELDRRAYREAYRHLDPALSRYLYRRRRAQTPSVEDSRSSVWAAQTPERDLVGFLWYFSELLDSGEQIVWIEQLYVLESYRRLGVADLLVRNVLEPLLRQPRMHVACNIPATAENVRKMFTRSGLRALHNVLYYSPDEH